MDVFDQYLFDEIAKMYAKSNLAPADYDEIYQRFLYLDRIPEVKPYLMAMRYLGLGTPANPDEVVGELQGLLSEGISQLNGLYYDLMLFKDENNSEFIRKLYAMGQDGYSDIYLKERSHLHAEVETEDSGKKESVFPALDALTKASKPDTPEQIQYKSMSFESCDYSGTCNGFNGLYFSAGDTAYLRAKVFIEPIKTKRRLSVRSQIFSGDEPFSKIFSDEFSLQPGDKWFTTTGWGNKDYNCYGNGIYEWRVELDGKTVHCQRFRMYGGKLNREGVAINSLKLFASKADGARESDRNNYRIAFDGQTLEYVYFKMFIDEPGRDMNVQAFIKVVCLEDDTVFREEYVLHQLQANTIACWNGVGFSTPGKWSKGLYQYSVRIGAGSTQEGTFTVY